MTASILAAAMLTTSPFAQGDIAIASEQMTEYCARAIADEIDRRAACACGTGILSERLSDTEFVLMSGLTPHVRDPEEMEGAVTSLIEEGVPARVLKSAAQKAAKSASRAEKVCTVLQAPKDNWPKLSVSLTQDDLSGRNIPVDKISSFYGDFAAITVAIDALEAER